MAPPKITSKSVKQMLSAMASAKASQERRVLGLINGPQNSTPELGTLAPDPSNHALIGDQLEELRGSSEELTAGIGVMGGQIEAEVQRKEAGSQHSLKEEGKQTCLSNKPP